MKPTHPASEPIYPDRHPTSRPTWIDVDLDALRRNAQRLRAKAQRPLIAMVKADAYGVGMLPVARALGASFAASKSNASGDAHAETTATPSHADGLLWGLGVATLDEAATLRHEGCTARIICTSPLRAYDLPEAFSLDVRPSLHRADDIVHWAAIGGGPWHLSIDTGMSRAGIRWDQTATLADALARHAPEGIFTHFHSAELADGSREEQDQRFADALASVRDAVTSNTLLHSDNSAGIAARSVLAAPDRHLARPGIGLYGSNVTHALSLEQIVHVRARIIDIRDVLDGESASYGATWHAHGTRRIATVALGYADGYRRALSNRGEAIVHGYRVPVAGTVTMDMTMLDVTALGDRCQIGDVATFIGQDGDDCLWTDDVAAKADISPYELLVGLRLRAHRRYFASDLSL